MERRAFVAGALATVVAPPVARAQNAPKLAMLLTGSPSAASPEYDAFMAQLAALGWIEGHQLTVDSRWADAPETFTRLALEASRAHPAVILTAGGPSTRR
jgi:hypothetical protein